MSLEEKLSTIVNNIPKVYNAGYEQGLAENGGSSGSNSEYHSGTFIPASNTLEMTVDVGVPYNHFLLVPNAEITALGVGLKTFFLCYYDRTRNKHHFIYSGNSGFSSSNPSLYSQLSYNTGYEPTYNETEVKFKNTTAGATLGYFLAGIEYFWLAW